MTWKPEIKWICEIRASMESRLPIRILTHLAVVSFLGACVQSLSPSSPKPVAMTPSTALAPDGQYISWVEHVIDAEDFNGGIAIRGGDGLAIADLDGDGIEDIVTAQEDSNHLRVAYGTEDPGIWVLRTIAQGTQVGAVEDVAIGDLNQDGSPDLVAACEDAHLIYLENPGTGNETRNSQWRYLIPSVTRNRGAWLRVFVADVNGDGLPDITAANKGGADIVRPGVEAPANGATSLFLVNANPLDDHAWTEQVLFREGIPNTAVPFDFDRDGDLDVLAAKRVRQELILVENLGTKPDGTIGHQALSVVLKPTFDAPDDWVGLANAFQADLRDMNNDGRADIVTNVVEHSSYYTGVVAGVGWLEQPDSLDLPWKFHRIGNTLPDWVIGIHVADIDGDLDLDVITGGYSGLNILAGSYSGASRDYDDPSVDISASVGRLAWFENLGDVSETWTRHDISRRVRGMYDMFQSKDLDGDGDIDIVAPRGNSGSFDGAFWLEQIRTSEPGPAMKPARQSESRHLPLPPDNWLELYDRTETFVAPNKK